MFLCIQTANATNESNSSKQRMYEYMYVHKIFIYINWKYLHWIRMVRGISDSALNKFSHMERCMYINFSDHKKGLF